MHIEYLDSKIHCDVPEIIQRNLPSWWGKIENYPYYLVSSKTRTRELSWYTARSNMTWSKEIQMLREELNLRRQRKSLLELIHSSPSWHKWLYLLQYDAATGTTGQVMHSHYHNVSRQLRLKGSYNRAILQVFWAPSGVVAPITTCNIICVKVIQVINNLIRVRSNISVERNKYYRLTVAGHIIIPGIKVIKADTAQLR